MIWSNSRYNIGARHESMVCSDETGVGKGRQAAGIVRYAKENWRLPIFFTEKKNLFSDFYRDFYRDAKVSEKAHYNQIGIKLVLRIEKYCNVERYNNDKWRV